MSNPTDLDPGETRTGDHAQNGSARPLGKGTGRDGNVLPDDRHCTGTGPLETIRKAVERHLERLLELTGPRALASIHTPALELLTYQADEVAGRLTLESIVRAHSQAEMTPRRAQYAVTQTARPRSNKPIPLVATMPDGTVERFHSVKAAERAGHNKRAIWSCRVGARKMHHGRTWAEVTS